ncbi:hypothetical protein QQS21_003577 [Conoideocrella luteorostrata]|uniref:BTB domain-containing protein n=1 Tax=Conoideocrella luteorostrata TaxID=1105319 RepID=A0AAJ0CT37_9HYPO|nr:hypothetical protein QQS21_003577 [Conoideocrella luteorostrata]
MDMDAAVASSKPFRFIIGPRGREFTIHSAVVVGQSPCLERLVNAPMREGIEGSVKWESIEEETFMCFWHYAYTGEYRICEEPTVTDVNIEGKISELNRTRLLARLAENSTETRTKSNFESIWNKTEDDSRPIGKIKKKKGTKELQQDSPYSPPPKPHSRQELSWAKFMSLRRVGHNLHANHPADNTQSGESGVEHLLCHAKVYVFAECYGITQLMILSYNKLHQSLANLRAHTTASTSFVDLVRFCYEGLVPDDLKELIAHFAACEVEKLWQDEEFQGLLDMHGGLGKAVIGHMLDRPDGTE